MKRGLICVCCWWILLMTCCADGILMRQETVKPLEIPRQTGVIIHRDGVQTLTIWNTVQTEASAVAWVLPLPAVPDVIQQTDPAAVRLLQLAAAPQMMISGGWHVFNWLAAIMFLTVGAYHFYSRRPIKSLSEGCAGVLFFITVWVFLAMFSGYGGTIMARGGAPDIVPGVQVLASQEVGNYDTKVVRGDSAGQLNAWLKAEGFMAFTGGQAVAVEDYLAKKWVFLCARLKVPSAGLTSVHPLTVRFPSPRLIYPMRLTEGAGRVPVDLYVVGDSFVKDPTGRLEQQVTTTLNRRIKAAPGMPYASVTDVLFALDHVRTAPPASPESVNPLSFPYPGQATPVIPEGKDILLDGLLGMGSSITHLSGVFSPGSDWSDITLEETESSAPLRRYRTRSAWLREAVESEWSGVAVLVFFVLGVVARGATAPGHRPHRGWLAAAIGVWVVSFFIALVLGARDTVFVDAARVARPAAGSPESISGLLNAWLQSLTVPTPPPP